MLKKYPYEVSGGQKQRAAVARAVITEPKLILADEPTGALDSKATDELLGLFHSLNASGQTIVMVTHSATCCQPCRPRAVHPGRSGVPPALPVQGIQQRVLRDHLRHLGHASEGR